MEAKQMKYKHTEHTKDYELAWIGWQKNKNVREPDLMMTKYSHYTQYKVIVIGILWAILICPDLEFISSLNFC